MRTKPPNKERPVQPDETSGKRRQYRLRKLLLAILAPVLLFGILELGLVLGGYGYSPSFFIRGPGTGTVVSNPRFAWRFFTRQISRAPLPIVFTAAKQPRTYRIFVLGSSAALGDPDASVSFARILESMLAQRFPDVRFEVINTGMTAINSHVVRPIAAECAAYNPDLYVVYTGNNEVIGPYGAGTIFCRLDFSLPLIRASVRLRSTRTAQLAGRITGLLHGPLAASTNRWQGMQMFLAQKAAVNDPRLKRVYAHFARNLDGICGAGRSAGADVILCSVLGNLKDSPPFHSDHKPDLSPADLRRWDEAFAKGEAKQQAGDCGAAVTAYEEAAAVDDSFALLQYRIGQCRLMLGDADEARRRFQLALDLDTFRFRADSAINVQIRATAGRWQSKGATLVDVEREVPARSTTDGIPGAELLYDHVHMNFDGNYAIASLLFTPVATAVERRLGSVPPQREPPSRDECARWLVYTPFSEFEAAKSMSSRMSAPPFTAEQGRRAADEMQRKLDRLSTPLLQEIADEYRSVLSRRPSDLLLRANYANVLYVMEDNEVAAEQYRLLLSTYPYASDWQYFLGDALAAANQPAEAEKWLRISLEQEPTNSETRRCLGLLLFSAGRTDEALKQYKASIALDPSSVRPRLELAQILLNNRNPGAAESQLTEAVRLAPNQAQPLLFLGMALTAQEKHESALNAFRQAAELDPASAAIQYNLASAHHRLGAMDKARIHYRQAVTLDPAFARPPYALGSQLGEPGEQR